MDGVVVVVVQLELEARGDAKYVRWRSVRYR